MNDLCCDCDFLSHYSRRTSKATGEADCIAKLVDKLRKTSRKVRISKMMNNNTFGHIDITMYTRMRSSLCIYVVCALSY